jgi:hypothetical protein
LTRTSKAKAKELKHIAEAIKSVTNDADLSISYDEGKIAVKALESQEFVTQATTIENRASDRILFKAAKQQQNLEKVTSQAAIELSSEQSVPAAKPDEDWIARFFDYAKNISSDQMQELWGRILAGEIKQPGRFSLRTLDTARNLSQQEATLFERVAKLSFFLSKGTFFIPEPNLNWMKENREIFHAQIFELGDLGLILQTQASYNLFEQGEERFLLYHGTDGVISIEPDRVRKPVNFNCWHFTKVGNQLINLVERPIDQEAMENFGRYFKTQGFKVHVASDMRVEGASLRWAKTKEL